jgi:hypothetical protein
LVQWSDNICLNDILMFDNRARAVGSWPYPPIRLFWKGKP